MLPCRQLLLRAYRYVRASRRSLSGLSLDGATIGPIAQPMPIAINAAAGSIEMHAALLHHLRPTRGFVLDEGCELRGRISCRTEPDRIRPRFYLGIAERFRNLARELVDDRRRRAARRDQAEPHRNIAEIDADGLRQRRQIGSRRERPGVELGERAQVAGLDERQHRGWSVEHEVDA